MSRWREVTIGDVCKVLNGGTPKTKVAEYWEGPHAWITPAEMGKRDSPYVESTARTLTDEGLANSSAKLVPPNSVILSTRAPIGHLVINTVPMAYNQGCRGLVPHDTLDHKFLFYFLGLNVDLLNDLGSGTTFKELSSTRLKTVRMPLPPLSEQKRIVSLLDAAFAAIDTATAHARQNLANARELFESHLNTVFEENDGRWKHRRLEDVCEKVTVGHVGPMKERYRAEGTPLLRSQNIRPFEVDLDNVVFIDDEFHKELTKSALRPGDLGIVRTGYPGTAAVIPDSLEVANCSDLVIVRPGDDADPHFLALFFNSSFGKRAVNGALVGAAQKHFNVTSAKAAEIPLPRPEDQRKVVAACQAVRAQSDQLAALYTHKLELLAELKQSMLHKAFAGELTADHEELDSRPPAPEGRRKDAVEASAVGRSVKIA